MLKYVANSSQELARPETNEKSELLNANNRPETGKGIQLLARRCKLRQERRRSVQPSADKWHWHDWLQYFPHAERTASTATLQIETNLKL